MKLAACRVRVVGGRGAVSSLRKSPGLSPDSGESSAGSCFPQVPEIHLPPEHHLPLNHPEPLPGALAAPDLEF